MWDPPNLQNLEEKLAGSFAYCVAYCVAEISERLVFPANSNRKDAGRLQIISSGFFFDFQELNENLNKIRLVGTSHVETVLIAPRSKELQNVKKENEDNSSTTS